MVIEGLFKVTDVEILTLSLTVPELPQFHLQFRDHPQLETWRGALLNLNRGEMPEAQPTEAEQDTSGTDEDDYTARASKRASSKRTEPKRSMASRESCGSVAIMLRWGIIGTRRRRGRRLLRVAG